MRNRLLLSVFLVGWMLRLALILLGGQFCWPDEWRYYRGVELLNRMLHGEWVEPLRQNLKQGGHVGFVFVSMIPAALQGVLGRFSGLRADETMWFPAALYALFSAGIPLLIHALALRVGAPRREALFAMLLSATSAALLYYSRHLFPYDLSMFCWLLALWVGLRPEPTPRTSLLCGLLAGAAFILYNGYWLATGLCLTLHVLWRNRSWAKMLQRTAPAFAGLITPVLLLILLGKIVGVSFLDSLNEHSSSLLGGRYEEGVRLPWLFLWHNEGLLLIGWLMGSVVALSVPRARVWVGMAIAIYAALALFSTGLEKWIVFGRLVRQMIPFLALGAAAGWAKMLRNPQSLRVSLVIWMGGVAFNWVPLFGEQFPDEFQKAAEARVGRENIQVMTSLIGPDVRDDPELQRPARYIVLNTCLLKPVNGEQAVPAGKVLQSANHPLQNPWRQYDGLWPHERKILCNPAHRMQLVDTQPESMEKN